MFPWHATICTDPPLECKSRLSTYILQTGSATRDHLTCLAVTSTLPPIAHEASRAHIIHALLFWCSIEYVMFLLQLTIGRHMWLPRNYAPLPVFPCPSGPNPFTLREKPCRFNGWPILQTSVSHFEYLKTKIIIHIFIWGFIMKEFHSELLWKLLQEYD